MTMPKKKGKGGKPKVEEEWYENADEAAAAREREKLESSTAPAADGSGDENGGKADAGKNKKGEAWFVTSNWTE